MNPAECVSLQSPTYKVAQTSAVSTLYSKQRASRCVQCKVSNRPTQQNKPSSPTIEADEGAGNTATDAIPASASVDILQSVDGDEPVVDEVAVDEAVVLLLATATGLATGLGVVLFNDLVHLIQDHIVWTSTPRLAAFGSNGLYRYPSFSPWQSLLLPPVVGGVVVAVLRSMAGGFTADPPAVTPAPRDTPPAVVKNGSQPASNTSDAPHSTSLSAETAALNALVTTIDDSAQPRPHKTTAAAPQSLEVAIPGRFPRLSKSLSSSAVAITDAPLHSLKGMLHRRGLQYTFRPYIKLVASAITLGSGASMGPEGPSVELGKATAERIKCAAREQVCPCVHCSRSIDGMHAIHCDGHTAASAPQHPSRTLYA